MCQAPLCSIRGTATDRFGYDYDRNSNRLYRENQVNDQFSELYHAGSGYDGFNQLTSFARGQLTGTKDGIVSGTLKKQIDWTFDALGNWTQTVTAEPPGSPVTQTRTHNQQNQLTAISSPDQTPAYDNNGNTTQDEKGRALVYDAWDRLVDVKTSPTGQRLVAYAYDALGRRVLELNGALKDFYYSASWQVLEERHAGAVHAHYVWSLGYVDELVLRDRDNGGAADLDERLYVQQDANYNVTAVVDVAGSVAQRYVYDPYGKPTALNASWGTLTVTLGWLYLHQGGRYHDFGDGTGLYHFRNRELSSSLGRWLQQDPIGFADGMNLYQLLRNSPLSNVDPSGLKLIIKDSATSPMLLWLNQLCPEGKWKVDAAGNVSSGAKGFCDKCSGDREKDRGLGITHSKSCKCVCDAIADKRPITLIAIPKAKWGRTAFLKDAAIVEIGEREMDHPGTGDKRAPQPGRVRTPPFLNLGHELCGHAVPKLYHPTDQTAYTVFDPVIKIENQLRKEHDYGMRTGAK